MLFRITTVLAVALFTVAAAGGEGATSELKKGRKVTVRVAFGNNGQDISDGSVAGKGRFTAKGAIVDRGKTVIYRTKTGSLITLRYVTQGKKGAITFVIKINIDLGTSRWTITSGTRAYKGLHGKGIERENATYTVSTLTGTVWR
jgi:hypothetical protein